MEGQYEFLVAIEQLMLAQRLFSFAIHFRNKMMTQRKMKAMEIL